MRIDTESHYLNPAEKLGKEQNRRGSIYELDLDIKVQKTVKENHLSANTMGCDVSDYCNYSNKCK